MSDDFRGAALCMQHMYIMCDLRIEYYKGWLTG